MLLSRFWYVLLALLLGAATFVLFMATSIYNRSGARNMGEGLSADSQVVSWYLKDDARQRSAELINFALNPDIAKYLAKSSADEHRVPSSARAKVLAALKAVNAKIPKSEGFDAVFAVDQEGRVVAHLGYDQANGIEDFELGGYPVVADALHGFIRDDTLVLDRLYRVVARPVEYDLGQAPAGAIIGARIIDDRFARDLSERTGAAIAFYANDERVASGAPDTFDKSQLDQIVSDLPNLKKDKDYQVKGRSNVRVIGGALGVVYARLPGEAWKLGAGYAVGRLPYHVSGPLGFFSKADDADKKHGDIWLVLLIVILAAGAGIGFSLLEHTMPFVVFSKEVTRLAKGETDQLVPSKFRGVYRKIASDLNDGIERVAAKGGVPRRAADLKQVLGDIPEQPQMSAFSFPGDPVSSPGVDSASQSHPRMPMPPNPSSPSNPMASAPRPPRPGSGTLASEASSSQRRAPPSRRDGDGDEEQWRQVFDEFVATKQQCGESTDGFTYEKFEQTLRRNRDALIERHGAKQVKFSVYVKEGKAALKASPIKD